MLHVLFLAAAVSLPAQEDSASNTLVWYDFEEEAVETGPYTLMVFEGAKGSVSLSSLYRYSGYRSVEIKDVAGDGKFAELQGFFTDKWHGYLFIHFAMLIVETEEPMHGALAHEQREQHGQGARTIGGFLSVGFHPKPAICSSSMYAPES